MQIIHLIAIGKRQPVSGSPGATLDGPIAGERNHVAQRAAAAMQILRIEKFWFFVDLVAGR